jgi:LysR family transcriptional regulator of abg operon
MVEMLERWQFSRSDTNEVSVLKLHHFRHAVAIAEQGSLRAAARHLQLAQPALTRSLGELERELGTPLFERQARGMVLTLIGQAFVTRATVVLNEVRRARDEVDQLRSGVGGGVSVGLSIAAHIAMLPKTIRPFRARFPTVQLHLIEGLYPTLAADLRRGILDFYIGPKPEQHLAPELVQEELFSNARTVLCRKGHPLSEARSLKQLMDAEWATTSITERAEKEFEELFEQNTLRPPRLVLRSQSALTLIVAIAYTDLLAMVPVQWTEFAPVADLLATIHVREQLPAPTIVLIRRAGVPLTPAASFLLDLMYRTVPSIKQSRTSQ